MTNVFMTLIMMFYVSALVSFVISCAAFSFAAKIRANILILAAIFAIFILSWLKLAL